MKPESQSFFSSIFTSILVILIYPHFKELFHKKTDSIFFKGSYDYWDVLGSLSNALISKIDMASLSKEIDRVLKRNLKTSFVKLAVPNNKDFEIYGLSKESERNAYDRVLSLLKDKIFKNEIIICEEIDFQKTDSAGHKTYLELRKITKELGIGVILPIFYQNISKGVFLLGNKLSNDLFTNQDIKILTIFSRHVGVALNNVELYEELKNNNLTLESKIQDRTQELKRLFEAQSKFLADISHELQTPLAIIKANVASLSKEGEKDKNEKVLGVVDETLNNMSVLLNNLLALARVDFGQEKIDKKPIDINKLIEEVYESFNPLASDKGIDFSFESSSEGPLLIKGSIRLIKELLLNLLSNAIKFTNSKGSIRIRLDANPNEVKIIVEDTGIGIPEKDIPYVFERFYQATNGEFRKGMGLGLAICKKIVDIHGGSIFLTSKEGEGSSFMVIFPRIFG